MQIQSKTDIKHFTHVQHQTVADVQLAQKLDADKVDRVASSL